MELQREHYRAMILYDCRVGLTATECHERLQCAFPDTVPSLATVYNWFRDFQRGKCIVHDGERSGRPSDVITQSLVARIEHVIRENRRVTYRQIQELLHVSSGTINIVLSEHLRVRKICCRWVPHSITDAQMQQRVDWCRMMREKFHNGDPRSVTNIYTGDETWLYAYDPETKQQSKQWVFGGEDRPEKC